MTVHLLPHADPQFEKAVLLALSESLDSCSAVVDRAGRIVGTTAAWETFQGNNPFISGQGLGTSYVKVCQDLVHAPDPQIAGMAQELLRVLEGRLARLSADFVIAQEEGRQDYGCTILARPPGDDILAVLHIRDITDRKKAEAERTKLQAQLLQAQKMESLGTLAAGIAHEINTPTQYIGNNTTFLRDAFLESIALLRTVQAHLERIREGKGQGAAEAVQALAALEAGDVGYLEVEIPKAIRQTLEGVARVSKIVGAMKDFAHPGDEAATNVDLHRTIENTITVSQGEWKNMANLETELAPDLPMVPCFPGEISQVLLNLVVNAAHAIEARRSVSDAAELGLIRIGTRLLPGEVELWVSDNGTGIPAEIRDRIFDPFFTTKSVGKGSGQGLAIVRAIITQKHKGRILLESTPGKGSTFRIFLPLGSPSS